MRKFVIHTVNGTYTKTLFQTDMDEIEAFGGAKALIDATAEVLGAAADRGTDMKLKANGIGWVALNPRHVIAMEFHGTEDVE